MHHRMQRLWGHAVMVDSDAEQVGSRHPGAERRVAGSESVRAAVLADHVERRPRTAEQAEAVNVRAIHVAERREVVLDARTDGVAVDLGPADVDERRAGVGSAHAQDDCRRVVAVGVVARGQREPGRANPQHGLRTVRIEARPGVGVDVHPAAEPHEATTLAQAAYVVRVQAGAGELCGGDQAVLCAHEGDGGEIHATHRPRAIGRSASRRQARLWMHRFGSALWTGGGQRTGL